jgi:hypothetical protein
VTPGREGDVASRTSKGLDALGLAMFAIADESMDVGIGDPKVQTLLIWTGEALLISPFGSSTSAFDLAPGSYRQRRRTRCH